MDIFISIREVILTLRFLNPDSRPCNPKVNTSNRPVRSVRAAPLEIDPVPGMGHKGISFRGSSPGLMHTIRLPGLPARKKPGVYFSYLGEETQRQTSGALWGTGITKPLALAQPLADWGAAPNPPNHRATLKDPAPIPTPNVPTSYPLTIEHMF